MSVSMLLASVLFAQSTAGFTVPAPPPEKVDVGYVQLVAGQPGKAIDHIRATGALEQRDPAALINLGTAYAMLGHKAEAKDAYQKAKFSSNRYDLELANGDWIDSRDAAILAEKSLEKGEYLALR
ncbi:tetratricopeptide repeat protein [Novosphingobium sp. ZN18A2]|uniref:tetratricopeptide repeat protein n=1 Tax=Novosphingobium sp. ZN18A2 TaxID=3079861 RepID=UPI0030D4F0C1